MSILDLDPEQLDACLGLAARMKRARAAGVPHERPLVGRHFALLFEKPSLRTRSTFQIAVRELGLTTLGVPSVSPAVAFVIGYAGGDFIENVAKIILKKPEEK